MSEDRLAQAKSLLTYVETDKGRIPYFVSNPDEWHPRLLVGLVDDLIYEVERLQEQVKALQGMVSRAEQLTYDIMTKGEKSIATLREALEVGILHDNCETADECTWIDMAKKAIATAREE